MSPGLSGSSILVGRDAELARAELLVDDSLRGRGSLLLLDGEAGIGKSVLAAAIAERARQRGATYALGCCYEAAGCPPSRPGNRY
jgi:predicted ATPase